MKKKPDVSESEHMQAKRFSPEKKKRIALCLPWRWLHANASRFSSSSHSHHNEDNILTQSRGFLNVNESLVVILTKCTFKALNGI